MLVTVAYWQGGVKGAYYFNDIMIPYYSLELHGDTVKTEINVWSPLVSFKMKNLQHFIIEFSLLGDELVIHWNIPSPGLEISFVITVKLHVLSQYFLQ